MNTPVCSVKLLQIYNYFAIIYQKRRTFYRFRPPTVRQTSSAGCSSADRNPVTIRRRPVRRIPKKGLILHPDSPRGSRSGPVRRGSPTHDTDSFSRTMPHSIRSIRPLAILLTAALCLPTLRTAAQPPPFRMRGERIRRHIRPRDRHAPAYGRAAAGARR